MKVNIELQVTDNKVTN